MRLSVPFIFLCFACSSNGQVVSTAIVSENMPDEIENEVIHTPSEEEHLATEQNSLYTEYPQFSALSDTYFNRRNTIPNVYSKIKDEIEEEEIDLFEGYRIQIFSGLDPALADTTAKRFRAWSASNINGYQAETYTFFKAPYYRVHVGDFHNRLHAIDFSNLLKKQFRDSWVVYDRVNPYNVPADTVQIKLEIQN